MMDAIVPLAGVAMVFIGFPWVVGHHVSQFRRSATLTREDETLLDELHELGRRLDERLCSIERIQTAENPNWRSVGCDPAPTGIETHSENERLRRIK
jgi:phage shock protein B